MPRLRLRVQIDANGTPRSMRVLRSLGEDFDRAAMDAVKKWRFQPATRNGTPVTTVGNIVIKFDIANSSGGGPRTLKK